MDELTFARPELAWLIVPVLAWAAWSARGLVRRRQILDRLGHGAVLDRLVATFNPRGAWARWGLTVAALVLLVLAATRPRYGVRETEVANTGIDIVFAVDASKSMLVPDVVPDRLRGTSLEIGGLLDRLAGGRVALVPFAGIPFVQCPLTTDHEVLRTYLDELRPSDMPVGGTHLGRAIELAVQTLTGEQEADRAEELGNLMPQFKGSEHKAIVLFSDGEDHEGGALEAAGRAKDAGIRIFTVGVGSAFGDPVPIIDAQGKVQGTLKDEAGKPIFSKLNAQLLEAIAKKTGGAYFHYADKTVVPPLHAAIDALEKAEYTARFEQLGEDRYQWLLAPALLLLLLAMAAPLRRRVQAVPLGPIAAGLLVIGLGTGAESRLALADANDPAQPSAETAGEHASRLRASGSRDESGGWLERRNPDVREGTELLEAGKAGEARQAFEAARESRPEHPVLWFALGLAQAALGERNQADESLGRALSALAMSDPAFEADIHYAIGTNHLQWSMALEKQRDAEQLASAGGAQPEGPGMAGGQAGGAAGGAAGGMNPAGAAPSGAAPGDEPVVHDRLAVEALQKALLADPSREDTRRNLELARLRAYPPCRFRDKEGEPDNDPAQAKLASFPEGERKLSLERRSCPGDRDLLRVALQPGDRLTARIKVGKDDATVVDPLVAAANVPAAIGVALRDADGVLLRGTEPPGEALTEVELGRWTADGQSEVLVDVRNHNDVEAPYTLELDWLPACPRIEDPLEDNDTPQTARAVPVGQPLPLRLCPRDDDHFAVPLQRGQGLRVAAKASFDVGAETFLLDILDPAGEVVATGVKAGEQYVARLAFAAVDGAYVVRVRGGIDTEADYQLALELLPPCVQRDDAFENNDQALTANPLPPDQLGQPLQNLHLCPGDDDWYSVPLAEGESLFVDLQASVEGAPDAAPLAGALTVTVYDEAGEVWAVARGNALEPDAKGTTRTAVVLAPPPGTYRVRVTGGGVTEPIFPLGPLPEGATVEDIEVGPPPTQAPAQGAPRLPGQGQMPPQGPQGPQGQAAPPPVRTQRITLPPNAPRPMVDRRRAQLDLPYALQMRILPPCPDGNDELEPNDAAGSAATFEIGGEQLLRICKGDDDWIALTQKLEQPLDVSARYDFAPGALTITATDEGGSETLAEGQTKAPRTGGGRDEPGAADTPEARRGRTAITGLRLPAPKEERVVKLHIEADDEVENFYILRVEEPPPPSDQGQQNKPQGGDDEQDDKDKKEPSDGGEQDKKESDKDDKAGEKDKQPPAPDDAARRRLEQRMKRHDRNPKNLEALEALRRSPLRNLQPSKDW